MKIQNSPLETIDSLDKALILAWHQGWHPETLDNILPWWRDQDNWIPVYIALLAWLLWKQKLKGLYLGLIAGATVGLANTVAAEVLKPLIGRVRPCNTVGLLEKLDLLTGCGPGLSFPSAHAATHFALAIFLGMTCFAERPMWKWITITWALIISLAQVYVGRHYFSDIIAGGAIGASIGMLGAWVVHRLALWPKSPTKSAEIG